MADDTDPSSKTEEPTGKRLDEARSRGEVGKSTDLASWASFAGTASALAIAGGWMCQNLAAHLKPFLERPDSISLDAGSAANVMRIAALAAVPALTVVLGAGMVTGVFGHVVQQGFVWTTERLKPDMDKVSPLSGFKRLFNLDGLVQFFKSVLKLVITGAVAWSVLKPHAHEVQDLSALDPAAILPFAAKLLKALVFAVIALLGVGAGLDWVWQKQRFMQKMRMSREELKEDSRQSDGDPHVKARLRQIRVTRARRRMMQAVPKATVVVTNPTHFAVALRYVAGETEAPICVAKGMDLVALKIREVAEENNVPIIEDPPLARSLFAAMEIDDTIPLLHYEAVAKIIGFVMGAGRRRARPHAP